MLPTERSFDNSKNANNIDILPMMNSAPNVMEDDDVYQIDSKFRLPPRHNFV